MESKIIKTKIRRDKKKSIKKYNKENKHDTFLIINFSSIVIIIEKY